MEWLAVLLTAIAAIPTAIAVSLVGVAWIAYANFKRIARQSASEEASQVAADIAEQEANRSIQRELPQILAAYRPYSARSGQRRGRQ